MSAARTAGVVIIGILLTATLFTGNIVFAAHQTVLDPGYVTTTIEEEGGYEQIVDQGVENAIPTEGEFETGPFSINQSEFMRDIITEEYVASQAEENIRRLYAYLHGNSDELNLTVETAPLAANAGDAAEAQVAERNPGDLAADVFAGGEFDGEIPVTEEMVRSLDDSQSSYQSTQDEFRSQVRERIVDEMVDEAFADASNDELLALVIEDYNPNDYTEAEKEQMVADRESEIRTALRTQITEERSDEVDERVDTAMAEIQGDLGNASVGTETDQEIVSAATDLQTAVATALTTDMTYDEYREDSTTARDDLAAAVGTMVEQRFTDELGESVSLTEEMTEEQRAPIDAAATQVQRMDLLAIVLPILALVFVGLVGFISRSPGRTGGTLGWAMLLSGVPMLLATGAITALIEQRVESADAEGVGADVVLGLFDGFTGALQTQSIILAVLGLVLVGVTLALRFEVIER
jgi:hypothetical protein